MGNPIGTWGPQVVPDEDAELLLDEWSKAV